MYNFKPFGKEDKRILIYIYIYILWTKLGTIF